MTISPQSPHAIIPATALYRGLAPRVAEELAHQLHRGSIRNSNDLIWALLTGLRRFAREHGVSLAADFPAAWPEALRYLRDARSEAEWDCLLPQTASAPQAAKQPFLLAASRMLQLLNVYAETTGLNPRLAVALGTWVVTAVVIAHSGPQDADITLEELADCCL